MDKYIIYSFVDKDYQPYYVGQTADLVNRLKVHLYLIKGKVADQYRKASIYPYYCKTRKLIAKGQRLRILILKQGLTREQADEYEIKYIQKYRNDPTIKLYNFLDGGRSGQKNKFVSEETKEKISRAKKGRPLSEEHKRALTGIKHQKPKWKPGAKKQWREKIRQGNLGKKMSAESNEKNRQAHLGKKHSQKTRDKLRQINTGKNHPSAKLYKIISPNGKEYKTWGLSTFCKKYRLEQSGLWFALHRENNKYKGWKIWQIEEPAS